MCLGNQDLASWLRPLIQTLSLFAFMILQDLWCLSGDVKKVLKDGLLNGAAVLGVPVKATIKKANTESFVVRTLDRKTLGEMQTPQVIKPELLRKGFELVNKKVLKSPMMCPL